MEYVPLRSIKDFNCFKMESPMSEKLFLSGNSGRGKEIELMISILFSNSKNI